ncbi:MAG: thioredoxin domain-containing protein [Gemmatimonadaceae bacterium]|nr:thioredoxin domain-containing protein [Gemmatimonadaceae bacterium]MCW5827327.1 thioredoxin domain-containing protein [Gemmatimonadaceae bacterium]
MALAGRAIMRMAREWSGQVAWAAFLLVGVGAYAWWQWRPAPPTVIREPTVTPVPPGMFARLNGRGPAVGFGPDTVIVFSHYACVWCVRLWRTVDSLTATGVGAPGETPTFRFRHVFDPDHAPSMRAAQAAECAARQGRFREMSRALFLRYDSLDLVTFPAIAEEAGVPDIGAFGGCMTSEEVQASIRQDLAAAAEFQVTGTPTLVTLRVRIGGTPGPARLLALTTASGT